MSTEEGEAYVYRYENGSWVEHALLTPSNAAAGIPQEQFGWSIDIEGGLTVVGARAHKHPDSEETAGAAYLYQRNATGAQPAWDEVMYMLADEDYATFNDRFGDAVTVDGDEVFIGATGDEREGEIDGAQSTSSPTCRCVPSRNERSQRPRRDGAAGGFSCSVRSPEIPMTRIRLQDAVSIVASALVAGIPASAYAQCMVQELDGEVPGGVENFHGPKVHHGRLFARAPDVYFEPGRVFVHEKIDGQWAVIEVMTTTITDSEWDSFGRSLDASEEHLFIGNEHALTTEDGVAGSTGAVEVFDFKTLGPIGVIPPPGDDIYRFGLQVEHRNGLLAVSAPTTPANGFEKVGTVFLYEWNGSAWESAGEIPHPAPEHHALFGWAITFTGDDTLLIGASLQGEDNVGRMYMFERIDGAWRLTQSVNPPPVSPPTQWFARWFCTTESGDRALIAAPQAFSQDGAAYIYDRIDGEWTMVQQIVAPDPVGNLHSFPGGSVLSDDGEVMHLGDPDDAEGVASGASYLFHWDEKSGQYAYVEKLLPPAPHNAGFGGSTWIEGDTAYISAGKSPAGEILVYKGIRGIDCNDNGTPDACDIHDGTSEDANANGVPDECEGGPCPTDINASGQTDALDLNILLADFACGTPTGDPPPCGADIDGDVDTDDLNTLLGAFGEACGE